MNSDQQFSRNAGDHEANLGEIFQELKTADQLLDVTLVTSKGQIKAHKIVLSACSPFFRRVLYNNPHQNSMIYLKGVSHFSLEKLVKFMYDGEVSIKQEDLDNFLEIANDLNVKGLTQNTCMEVTIPSKRQRIEINQGNIQEPPQSLNMIFYSNPTVKIEPTNHPYSNPTVKLEPSNHPTASTHTSVNLNHPAVKQSLPVISSIVSVVPSSGQEVPSGHCQALAMAMPGDSQNLLRVKQTNELITHAKIIENKTLGLWMCSACTFTHPGLTTMQQHIQAQHF